MILDIENKYFLTVKKNFEIEIKVYTKMAFRNFLVCDLTRHQYHTYTNKHTHTHIYRNHKNTNNIILRAI